MEISSILEVANMRKISFVVLILCLLISIKNQNKEPKKGSSSFTNLLIWPYSSWDTSASIYLAPFSSPPPKDRDYDKLAFDSGEHLEYDFYRNSCPQAEKIVRETVAELYQDKFSVAPALLRLVFHDCFIEGCDASVLLDAAEGIESEKDSPPNLGLKGYDIIDKIKSRLEAVCPRVVSCADIVVLAAREGVVQAGGPFYPLSTGRRDSLESYQDLASNELPSPDADLPETLATFSSRGFDERETVSILGAHSIGEVHCRFLANRIYNFSETNKPDPSIAINFLNLMRSTCKNTTTSTTTPVAAPSFSVSPSPSTSVSSDGPDSPLSSAAPSPSFQGLISSLLSSSSAPSPSRTRMSSPEEPGIQMAYEGPGVGFGSIYYHSLLQSRGILHTDQQLLASEETGIWVRAYASDRSLFRRDFSLAMMKLSNLQLLTGSMGQVREICSKVA